jgi:hypothetical protein
MSSGLAPSSSGPCNDWNRKVKNEGRSSGLRLSGRGITAALYTEVLKLLVNDGSCSFTRKDFAGKYGLCYIGISPKQIWLSKDCMEEEVHKFFGLVVNKNGHCYIECLGAMFITKLWMTIHQKPYVLVSRLTTLGMARRIICEQKGKEMN